MNPQEKKEKMLELIKKKQSGGRSKDMEAPKNDRKNMRKGPKIYNKQVIKKTVSPIREIVFFYGNCGYRLGVSKWLSTTFSMYK